MDKRTRNERRGALMLYARLMRTVDAVSHQLHAGLADHGLTVSQFAVLEALMHKGDLELGQLARAILKTSGNLTTVVDNLERDGLVRRVRSETDRRRILVALTTEGRSLIGNLFPAHGDRAAGIMSVLDEDEQDQLSRLLRRLYKEQSSCSK